MLLAVLLILILLFIIERLVLFITLLTVLLLVLVNAVGSAVNYDTAVYNREISAVYNIDASVVASASKWCW